MMVEVLPISYTATYLAFNPIQRPRLGHSPAIRSSNGFADLLCVLITALLCNNLLARSPAWSGRLTNAISVTPDLNAVKADSKESHSKRAMNGGAAFTSNTSPSLPRTVS